jgi:hypothetical protein
MLKNEIEPTDGAGNTADVCCMASSMCVSVLQISFLAAKKGLFHVASAAKMKFERLTMSSHALERTLHAPSMCAGQSFKFHFLRRAREQVASAAQLKFRLTLRPTR